MVTGGTGFIGSHLTEALLNAGAEIMVPTSSGNTGNLSRVAGDIRLVKADLTDVARAAKIFRGHDIIMHLAAKVAGIRYNISHPAVMLSANVRLNQSVLDAAVSAGIGRMLLTSSACVYPRLCPQPMTEESGFLDVPEPTNMGYGWSKRFTEVAAKQYATQYGMEIAVARPFNAYGPRDCFDPAMSHVIPGLIKRIYGRENPLVVWGTGSQTRSFIYVTDIVRGMMLLTEKYAVADPVNLGSSQEISMGELARMLIRLSGKRIQIRFDRSKPDGQPRRAANVGKARKVASFKSAVLLEEGLRETLSWYEHHLLS